MNVDNDINLSSSVWGHECWIGQELAFSILCVNLKEPIVKTLLRFCIIRINFYIHLSFYLPHMRYLFTFLLVFFSSLLAVAQTNLVPNPSFEDFITCPSAFDQLDRVTNWSSFGGSPDYINECANAGGSSVGVPQNTWGFQYAKDGKGYLFFGTYDIQSLPNNTREYVGVQLTQPLTIGNRYFVSAFVSRADSNYANGATNNIGFRFTDQSYSKLMPFVPDNFAQINCDTIIYDQQNWVQLFGSFVSDTAFQYLIIGNFFR
ncbi:MAG: hypothetical protein IPP51_07995 [Bacteroidetes bacterium]|nr:hypothetical protein [Bacteroidota bacterium]